MFIVGMKVNIIASIDVILMFLSITHQTFVLIRPDQGVLKISFVFIFRRRLQDALKTSSRRLSQDQYIRLGHMSSRRLQDVFKTFSRHFQDFLQNCLQDIFKTSSRRLQDIFKTSLRRLQNVLRSLQDVFKTSSRRLAKTPSRHLQDVFKAFWRRLQDIFKSSCKDTLKTFSRLIKLNCSC